MLIPSGASGCHLFVSIFDIKVIDNKHKVLLAPIESQRPKYDETCPLAAGEHPFVKHPSFVGYNHCRTEDLSHVLSCIDNDVYKVTHAPVSDTLLARIKIGFANSKRVPRFIKNEWDDAQ